MSDKSARTVEDALPGHESGQQEQPAASLRNNQPPTPPRSTNTLCDYSDVESVDSQRSPRRRRHRGGRKKRERKLQSVLQSTSEFEIPKTTRQEPETQTDADSVGSIHPPEEYDEEELQKARLSRASGSTRERSSTKDSQKDTRIKAFSVTRPESSSRRPVGITIERPKQVEEARHEGDGPSTTKGEEKPGGRKEEEEHKEKTETETETETRKPVSIRLDLNLEVEILLRAKIKGDITITFL